MSNEGLRAPEKLTKFVFDHAAFKQWWNNSTAVTGDENTAWLAWCAALRWMCSSRINEG